MTIATSPEITREKLQLFRYLIDNSNDSIFVIDPETGRFLDVNKRASNLLHYEREELLSMGVFEIDAEITGIEAWRRHVEEVRDKGNMILSGMHRRRDGTSFPVEINVKIMRRGEKEYMVAIARDVTELRKTEESLKKSEAQLKEAQRLAHIGSWELDLTTNVLSWSDEIYRIFEIDPKRFAASYEAFLQTVHPEDRAMVDAAYTNSVRTRTPYAIDHRLLFADGRIKYVHEECETFYDREGKPLRSLGTVQDITERKKAEEEARHLSLRLGLILDSAGEGIYGMDLRGCCLLINRAASKMLGYESDELVGKPIHRMIHHSREDGSSYPLEECPVHKTCREGVVHRGADEIFWRQDGGNFPVEYISTPIRHEGRLVGAVVSFMDIAERRQADETLRRSEERYRRLIDSVTDYIYTVEVKDGKPLVTKHGPGCVAVTGYTQEECDADPFLWRTIVMEADREAVVEQAERVLSGCSVAPLEYRIVHKDGTMRWVRNTPVPRYDARGKVVAYDGMVSDITEQRKMEDLLRHMQKMEAFGQLAGGIAHDFNNILTSIISFGYVLQMRMRKEDPLRKHVEQMLASTERGVTLTRGLLAFARKQVTDQRPVWLKEVLNNMGKLVRSIIGEDIALQISIEDNLPVKADTGQIEQVIINLCTNARDAMPEGGSLIIRAEPIDIDAQFVKRNGYGKPGRYARIIVADTGSGMDAATKEKIFEPFFTGKEAGKGTGLGLSIVYGIIEQHHGYIDVDSEPGKGTTFKIYLPLTGEAADSKSIAEEEVVTPAGKETILLADDDEGVRTGMKAILENCGYAVIEAVDGEDAVRKFMDNRSAIQLVILDVVMPLKDGRAASEEIRSVCHGTRIIFVSGYSEETLRNRGAIEEGAIFLMKPISPSLLLRTVFDVLKKGGAE